MPWSALDRGGYPQRWQLSGPVPLHEAVFREIDPFLELRDPTAQLVMHLRVFLPEPLYELLELG